MWIPLKQDLRAAQAKFGVMSHCTAFFWATCPSQRTRMTSRRQNNNKTNGSMSSGGRRRRRRRGNTVGGYSGGGGAVSGRNAMTGFSFSRVAPGMNIRSMPLFGLTTRRNLPYANSYISASSGTGTAGAYVFSANGLFDPNITGTGGQPMGFDQMMLFYNHYTVLRSRIRVMCATTSTGAPCVGIAITGNATPLTSVEQIMEVGKLNFVWLEQGAVSNSRATLHAAVDLAKFNGYRNIMDENDARGDVASNPTEQTYYIIYVWFPLDTTIVTAGLSVFLEYDTVFHEPKSASLSARSQALPENGESKSPPPDFEFVLGKMSTVRISQGALHHCPVALRMEEEAKGFPPPMT